MAPAEEDFPGKFGGYYEARKPTKNELEWKWIEESRSAAPDLSDRDLLRKRFASMR